MFFASCDADCAPVLLGRRTVYPSGCGRRKQIGAAAPCLNHRRRFPPPPAYKEGGPAASPPPSDLAPPTLLPTCSLLLY